MKKTKNAGITLVALVITIIILLILAGITISQLTGSGLFENAKLAEERSKNAQEKEDDVLSDYENEIGQYVGATRNEELQAEIKKLKSEKEQLEAEIEVLKGNNKKLAGIFLSWKRDANWNEAGISVSMQIDTSMCTNTGGTVSINESGRYLISMYSLNSLGGGKPVFQLYRNGTMVKEYSNSSGEGSGVTTSLELDVVQGDAFYGKIYGGGSNPTFFVTSFYKISE